MCFFSEEPKDSNFELKSPTNMTLSDKLLMRRKRVRSGFSFEQ